MGFNLAKRSIFSFQQVLKMDKYVIVIILTTIGFFALAAILLVPVWRFLSKEEEISEQWTDEKISERHRRSDP